MDPIHQRMGESVAVVVRNRQVDPSGKVRCGVEACDLDLVIYQYVGDDNVWIAVVEGEHQRQRLEVSLESAQRLVRRLSLLLDGTR